MRWYSLSRRSTSSDQKAPPLAGELSVSDSEQTEGEQLTALGSFKPFPFRHGSRRDTFPARGDSFWVALPPACPERGGGCECNEQTEGLHRGCSYLRQPLSQSALRRIASSPAGEPFGCDTICQDIRVNAQVGTRSPYSLPFVILPVPARSPFRLLVHRTRSTPNPIDKPPFSGL